MTPHPTSPHALARRIACPSDQARASLFTLRDLIRYATSRFEAAGVCYGHGTDGAHDEAVWLMLWVLHLAPDRLDPYLDARLTAPEIDAALELIDSRVARREPAAYLTGEAWLRGVRFLADRRALVPRSLLAEALDESLQDWLDEAPDSVLDLCTGGGSLAILAARRFESADIVASDLSAEALSLAGENVALHGLGGRIRLVRGDLFAALGGERFDLILCNPPYVNADSMAALPAEYRAEPVSALAGGDDGMDVVRRILDDAAAHLTSGGRLLLEIGHERQHFEAAFPALQFAYLPVASGEDRIVLLERAWLTGSA